jgi:hypothetical protein
MALPWLIGAAAVATVGYLASSSGSSSSDDDDEDYYKKKRDAEKREKRRKERKIEEEEEVFCKKWGIDNLNSDFDDSPKMQKLIQKEQSLEKKIEELEALALEIKNI